MVAPPGGRGPDPISALPRSSARVLSSASVVRRRPGVWVVANRSRWVFGLGRQSEACKVNAACADGAVVLLVDQERPAHWGLSLQVGRREPRGTLQQPARCIRVPGAH